MKRYGMIFLFFLMVVPLVFGDEVSNPITGIKMPELISKTLLGYSLQTQALDTVLMKRSYVVTKGNTRVNVTGLVFDSSSTAYHEASKRAIKDPSYRRFEAPEIGEHQWGQLWRGETRFLFHINNVLFDIQSKDNKAVFFVARAFEQYLKNPSSDTTVFTFNSPGVTLKKESCYPSISKDGYITLEFEADQNNKDCYIRINSKPYKLDGSSTKYYVGSPRADILLQIDSLTQDNYFKSQIVLIDFQPPPEPEGSCKVTGIRMPELIRHYLPAYSFKIDTTHGDYYLEKNGIKVRLAGKVFDSTSTAYKSMVSRLRIHPQGYDLDVFLGDRAVGMSWGNAARVLFQKNNIYFDIQSEDSTAVFEVGKVIEKYLNEKSMDTTVFIYNQPETSHRVREAIKDGYVSGVDIKELINKVISPNENNIIRESTLLHSVGREIDVLDSEKKLKYVLRIAVYPNKDKLIETVNTYRTTISEVWTNVSTENCVIGDIVWKSDNKEVIYSRNNLLVSVYSKNNDYTEIAKKIDNLIINQKSPFKYSKNPPSAPIPEIPKQIKNNAAAWRTLFKDYSGAYTVISNGQVIYCKYPTEDTFTPATLLGKVKLTINIAADDNLFDTREIETELVP